MALTCILASKFGAVMKSFGGVALAIVILLAMVTIHEFGHYVAGKLLKFKINEFSVGFGPAIFKKRSKKTGELFALRIIPLGGYCAFDGEDEDDEPAKKTDGKNDKPEEEPFEEYARQPILYNGVEALPLTEEEEAETPFEGGVKIIQKEEYPEPKGKRFNEQAPWKRIIVLVAGAAMNYLLGLLLLVIMFSVYGCVHSYVMHTDTDNPPVYATEECLQAKDIVLSIDGKGIYMATDYGDILSGKKAGDVVTVKILRRNDEQKWENKTLKITLETDCNFKNMNDLTAAYTAFGLDESAYVYANVTMRENFFETVGYSFVFSFKLAGTVLRSLGELVTFKLGFDAIGGPVSTIQATAQAATSGGAFSTLYIAAFIGVNLAVFNLLPVPALDGCKIVFCIIEWIRKKPINRKVEAIINLVGIVFLFGFAILVDILHFIL